MKTKETRALLKRLRSDIHTWLSAVSLSSLSWSKTASPGWQTCKRLLWRASRDSTSTGANLKQSVFTRGQVDGVICCSELLLQALSALLQVFLVLLQGLNCTLQGSDWSGFTVQLGQLWKKNTFSYVYSMQEVKSPIAGVSKIKMWLLQS